MKAFIKTDRHKTGDEEAPLERVLQFERLLTSLSSKFINLPSERVEEEIKNGLKKVVAFLNADRSTFFELDQDSKIIRTICSYEVDGVEPFDTKVINAALPWYTEKIIRGEMLVLNRLPDVLPEKATIEKEYCRRTGLRSNLTIPIITADGGTCAIAFGCFHTARKWPEALLPRLRLVGEVFARAMIHKRTQEKLYRALYEIKRLQERLEKDCTYLQEEVLSEHNYENIIGNSNAIKYVLLRVDQVAPTEATVLVMGETGTGKELIARAIHHASPRCRRPLVKVNCAALPPDIIESELFGHEKGAFSGAWERRVGRFEYADGATLFLDEIGELPLDLQPKLLRVIEDGEFERVGSSRTRTCDVRILAATSRDLEAEVKACRFRKDLWYRLNVFPITVPPLRERREDIPLLVRHFVEAHARKMGKNIRVIPTSKMELLTAYAWPGNIRELQNVIEHSVIISQETTLQLADTILTVQKTDSSPSRPQNFDEMQRRFIEDALDRASWKIEGPSGAACMLDLKPSTLRYRMKKLGIRRRKTT